MSSLLKRNKILFNVHLILSIVFSIPLLIIGVTGAILSYQHEFEALINAGSKKIEKTGEMQSV